MNKTKVKVKEHRITERQTGPDGQTVRFLQWIRRYPGWWELICTPADGHMTIGMMKTLIEALAKEQFYEIIFVLLTVHREAAFLKPVMEAVLVELILSGWKGETRGKEELLESITDLLT